MLLEVTDYNFKDIINVAGLAVIDFWSEGCRPCVSLNPVIKNLAEIYPDITVGKINIIENQLAADHFSISAVPTILFFKNGELVKKVLGYHTETQLKQIVNELK